MSKKGQPGTRDAVIERGFPVRAVLFDFGGVLAEEGFRAGLRSIAQSQGLDPDSVYATGTDAVYATGYVTGSGNEAAFWQYMRARFPLVGDDKALSCEILGRFVLRPGMIGLVRWLRRQGIVVGILSDQTPWLDQLDARDHFFAEFDRVYISYRIGKGKRDASLFDDVVRDLGIGPAQVVFVDDDCGNVERARARGLRAIQFVSETRLLDELGGFVGAPGDSGEVPENALAGKDNECTVFLQWALPALQMRWEGFRKVRGQVCRRIRQRVHELGLADISGYPPYLETHPEEWAALDTTCHITISRFYRNHGVFHRLEQEILPALAELAVTQGDTMLHVWSAGCASGEEPYSVAILFGLQLKPRFPALDMHIVATDVDDDMLRRARKACYEFSSLKYLPRSWLTQAFMLSPEGYCLRDDYRRIVDIVQQDIRLDAPAGPFHVVFCRNLAFTYFAEGLQQQVLQRIKDRLVNGGVLVTGVHEVLPPGVDGFISWRGVRGVYQKMQ